MHLFFQPDLTSDTLLLSEDESKHAVRVLRLAVGSQVELVDGRGTRALAEVRDDHPKRCALEIVSRKTEPTGRSFHLHIAVAPTKNIERIEWFLEKASEIGIDEITLLDCEHSERSTVKTERLEKVAVSAMKQSQQSWMPVINEMQKFDAFIAKASADVILIAHCEDSRKNPINGMSFAGKKVLVIIGPEGDFSSEEISSAVHAGFSPVSLGETRLRTETAAFYALMAIHLAHH